jgi:hypothetical protein
MDLSLIRILCVVAAVTAVAFVLSFLTRHAKHGFGLYLGDVAWPTLLLGALLTLLLLLAVGARALHGRFSARPTA